MFNRNNWSEHIFISVVVVTTILCMFTPDVVWLKKIAAFSVQYMVLLFGAGMIFFVFNRKHLLFTCLGCCAALCIYFKTTAEISLAVPRKTAEPTIKIAHMSTSQIAENWEENFQFIAQKAWDVLTFTEVTPDWAGLLRDELSAQYPYSSQVVRIDNFGLAIYSKYPIVQTDTILTEDVPNAYALLQVDEYICHLTCSNTEPPLYRASMIKLKTQLLALNQYLSSFPDAVLTTGNYHLDQFADEIQEFRARSHLKDSRKTMSPSITAPTDHIFFNNALECLSFSNIYNQYFTRIGIQGEYQFNLKS